MVSSFYKLFNNICSLEAVLQVATQRPQPLGLGCNIQLYIVARNCVKAKFNISKYMLGGHGCPPGNQGQWRDTHGLLGCKTHKHKGCGYMIRPVMLQVIG